MAAELEVDFKMIPLEGILPSGTNPRKTFDAKALEDLTASIKDKGVLQPVLVRFKPRQHVGGTSIAEHYELVAGERRWRAARKAGLKEIPAVIRQLTDDQALEAQVVENLQRADVHPLEEAEGYQALLKRGRLKVEDLAAKVNKSVSYIWQRIKLTELIEPAKKAFLEDAITAGHAVLIARLQPSDQKSALEVCATREWMQGTDRQSGKHGRFVVSVRDLSVWIQDNVHLSLDGAPWQKNDATLVPQAGACDSCPKRAGNSPALWPDIQRAQTCTDRACFQKKLNAHLARKAEELKAEGKKIVKISERYSPEEKGVLGSDQFREIGKGAKRCPSTAIGFVVDGRHRGKTTDVCTDRDGCSIHRPRSASNSSGRSNKAQADYEKQRQKEIIKERATERARRMILGEILKKTKAVGRADLELLAAALNRATYFSDWDSVEGFPKGLDETYELSEFQKSADADLAKYVVALAISHELRFHEDPDFLYATAKRHKLNVKAIEKKALDAVLYDKAHKERMQRWKGLVASQKKSFEILTCKTCGRTQADQAKGGWHWLEKNEKSKVATCNDCDRLERK
jgi:ParB family chromosome partitioning protein